MSKNKPNIQSLYLMHFKPSPAPLHTPTVPQCSPQCPIKLHEVIRPAVQQISAWCETAGYGINPRCKEFPKQTAFFVGQVKIRNRKPCIQEASGFLTYAFLSRPNLILQGLGISLQQPEWFHMISIIPIGGLYLVQRSMSVLTFNCQDCWCPVAKSTKPNQRAWVHWKDAEKEHRQS